MVTRDGISDKAHLRAHDLTICQPAIILRILIYYEDSGVIKRGRGEAVLYLVGQNFFFLVKKKSLMRDSNPRSSASETDELYHCSNEACNLLA